MGHVVALVAGALGLLGKVGDGSKFSGRFLEVAPVPDFPDVADRSAMHDWLRQQR